MTWLLANLTGAQLGVLLSHDDLAEGWKRILAIYCRDVNMTRLQHEARRDQGWCGYVGAGCYLPSKFNNLLRLRLHSQVVKDALTHPERMKPKGHAGKYVRQVIRSTPRADELVKWAVGLNGAVVWARGMKAETTANEILAPNSMQNQWMNNVHDMALKEMKAAKGRSSDSHRAIMQHLPESWASFLAKRNVLKVAAEGGEDANESIAGARESGSSGITLPPVQMQQGERS